MARRGFQGTKRMRRRVQSRKRLKKRKKTRRLRRRVKRSDNKEEVCRKGRGGVGGGCRGGRS